jgi:hypothetical protein
MKRLLNVALALVLVVVLAQFAHAQDQGAAKKDAGKPGAIVAESVTLEATVVSVDAAKRTVTIKSADGVTKTFKVGKEVKNFDQIKAGDKVKTTFFESIAVFVRKSNEKASASEATTVGVAPLGAKPGVFAVDTFEITAKVQEIDVKKRIVTLKGPEGNVRAFKVDKSVENLDKVKAGDELVVRVTDAVAIAVEKP